MRSKIVIAVVTLLISLSFVGCTGLRNKQASPQSEPINNTSETALRQPQQLSSVRMFNATTGWALGHSAILRTSDGGKKWLEVTPPGGLAFDEPRDIVPAFFDASNAWVATLTGPPSGVTVSVPLTEGRPGKKP